MNVMEAIEQLRLMRNEAGGDAPLRVYIQTGPDSWEWKSVTHFAPVAVAPKLIVEVGYGGEDD